MHKPYDQILGLKSPSIQYIVKKKQTTQKEPTSSC
jgi:hypothetical protein